MSDVQALETYCATLREALSTLVEAVEHAATMPVGADLALRYWYSPQWALEHAQQVLALDVQGAQAQRDWLLHMQIATLAYIFADFLHDRLLGRPRTEFKVPSPDEVLEALRELEVLTQATFPEAPHA
jgi:hypothetical protein